MNSDLKSESSGKNNDRERGDRMESFIGGQSRMPLNGQARLLYRLPVALEAVGRSAFAVAAGTPPAVVAQAVVQAHSSVGPAE